jgi:hypothetical protein
LGEGAQRGPRDHFAPVKAMDDPRKSASLLNRASVTKAVLLLSWFVAWAAVFILVDRCSLLSTWKPRFGSNHQSCDKSVQAGFVWAHAKRAKFEQ